MSAGLLILEHREVFGERFKCQRLGVKLTRISPSRVWIISLTAARRFGLHVALSADHDVAVYRLYAFRNVGKTLS